MRRAHEINEQLSQTFRLVHITHGKKKEFDFKNLGTGGALCTELERFTFFPEILGCHNMYSTLCTLRLAAVKALSCFTLRKTAQAAV